MKQNRNIEGSAAGKGYRMGVAGGQLSQRSFAASIGGHRQTLDAVITGRRKLMVEMALKIERALGYDMRKASC